MSKLERKQATHRWVKLESVEATFPAKDHADSLRGDTKLTIIIEKSETAYDDGAFEDREPPKMRINPSHGFGGWTRAESAWIAKTVPLLWEEWDQKVTSKEG